MERNYKRVYVSKNRRVALNIIWENDDKIEAIQENIKRNFVPKGNLAIANVQIGKLLTINVNVTYSFDKERIYAIFPQHTQKDKTYSDVYIIDDTLKEDIDEVVLMYNSELFDIEPTDLDDVPFSEKPEDVEQNKKEKPEDVKQNKKENKGASK